ncbi:N-acetylglucosaminyldiphosphoundecaprenol N-acetyl-beta-D-mannosaminyltransferase [Acaryochloris thomasi RCC1774]|uniref:N-acetylglucosaminyldiphosphoundecaprenol N-acetyl-beta-D-mannosaminyltransferase n=1 Tax=Acaryochloris thomasi RCC1774 TaxID=1764569 RepID=A0A2W1JD48_9CYAN|nr:WecB/TagA/CpsF family glycosyltransferase [Acaryochloris thomasi]PZD71789.1 N-acetylglucosaminyldiphosphoundecaprenol N-acetyl-beta-D-mannosaminyltransferase [Acaryochloris thomasi RCC1774]
MTLSSSTLSPSHSATREPVIEAYLLERRITFMTTPTLVNVISDMCTCGKKFVVANYNVHGFNLSMQLPWLDGFHKTANITHCDGMGIIKLVNILGLKLPKEYKNSYTLLMPELLERCNERQFSVYLLGGKPEQLTNALINLKNRYSEAHFSGHDGYFSVHDSNRNESIINEINAIKPNVLIVGMGMPLQEQWVDLYRDRIDVNAIMLGGAVIDRFAGLVPDCPHYISDLGLEWLFRLLREPRRLMGRYLLGNPVFLLNIALASALGIRPLTIGRVDENWQEIIP